MPFVNIDGIETYYEMHGRGDTLLLLHHGFGSTKIWEGIYQPLVEHGYRAVMYDRRGFGRTEEGDDFKGFYTSDRYCSESVRELAVLTETLRIDSFHLVGQCEGGVIAVEYALRHPEQARSIFLSSTQCYRSRSMGELHRFVFQKSYRDMEPEFREKFTRWHGEGRAEGLYNLFLNYPGGAYGPGFSDLRKVVPSIGCPAFVLYPDRSPYFEVEQGVAFYRHLPEAELAVLPHCGHNTYEHRPKEYAGYILEFLKRHHY